MIKTIHHVYKLLITISLLALGAAGTSAQEREIPVEAEQVRESPVERSLPLSGRVFSRNEAAMSLTLSGELEWVLEPGIRVTAGTVIAQLDQQPILLRKAELEHLAERERVNGRYLDKELARLRRLQKDNNASERQVDEGASNRDISQLVLQSLQARIDQLDDELRRSQLIAPFDGVIAERDKRGGEYARPGDVIVRLVDLDTLELRFQMPVVHISRISDSQEVSFTIRSGQLSGAGLASRKATIRAIIPAANHNSQTFEVRADLVPSAGAQAIAGQLVSVVVPLTNSEPTIQIPRDAVVLRGDGNYVFRISSDNTAEQVMVEVGEGSRDWVSVTGELQAGDWVAIRGVERLQDGQRVSRGDS